MKLIGVCVCLSWIEAARNLSRAKCWVCCGSTRDVLNICTHGLSLFSLSSLVTKIGLCLLAPQKERERKRKSNLFYWALHFCQCPVSILRTAGVAILPCWISVSLVPFSFPKRQFSIPYTAMLCFDLPMMLIFSPLPLSQHSFCGVGPFHSRDHFYLNPFFLTRWCHRRWNG